MGLQENLHAETVRSLPLREPVTATATESIQGVVEKMRKRNLGCAIVVDETGRPLGMFTESQLLRMLVKPDVSFEANVGEVMTTNWPTVTETEPIVNMLNAMRSMNVRFVIVVNGEGTLVGLTGQRGLLEYIADHFPEQVMVQRIGGTPHLNKREGA